MVTTKLVGITAMAGIAIGVMASGWAIAGDALTPANGNLGSGNEVLISSTTDQPQSASLSSVDLSNSPQESSSAVNTEGSTETAPEPVVSSTTPDVSQASVSERRRKVDHHSIESMPENELRILESLKKPAAFDYFDTRLEDVAAEIANDYKIQVLIDEGALEDAGTAGPEELITMKIQDVSLENALELMLDKKHLTTIIKNEVLMITSQDVAYSTATTRVYRCSSEWAIDNQEIMETVLKGVEPTSWEENGGRGTISIVTDGLVISAPQEIHRQINNLFAQFQRLYGGPEENR